MRVYGQTCFCPYLPVQYKENSTPAGHRQEDGDLSLGLQILLRKSEYQYLSSVSPLPHSPSKVLYELYCLQVWPRDPFTYTAPLTHRLEILPQAWWAKNTGPQSLSPPLTGLSFHTREDKPRRQRVTATVQQLIYIVAVLLPEKQVAVPVPFQGIATEVLLKGKAGHRTKNSSSYFSGNWLYL